MSREQGEAPRQGNNLLVLGKITQILDSFALSRPALTLREIQAATGLPASTTQRLVANLVAAEFLDREGDKVRIGMRMAYWGAAAVKDFDTLAVVRPVLRELRDATGETACLYVLEGHQRVCVAVAVTHHALRREMHVGKVSPLNVGSAGRVLLAWSDVDPAELVDEMPRLTERSVTDPEELRELVRQTRHEGYAITVGERVDAASGLSAPVFDGSGELVGALMVHGPTLRLPVEACERLVELVVGAAERITRTLGGQLPPTA